MNEDEYIIQLEEFIAHNVDCSYFDEDDEDMEFFTRIHTKIYPENYEEDYVKMIRSKYEYK